MQLKNPLLQSTLKLKEFFQECQRETPDLEKLKSFVNMGVKLTLKDDDEKTGLDYICEKESSALDAALLLIEAQCPVTREVAYQLIGQAVQRNSYHRLIILLMVNCIEQEDLYPMIKPFAQAEGNIIQKLMHLLVSVNEFKQMEILFMLQKLLDQNQDAELIMETAWEHYSEEPKRDRQEKLSNILVLEEIADTDDEDPLQFDLELSPRKMDYPEVNQRFAKKASPHVNFNFYSSINTQSQNRLFENKNNQSMQHK